MEFAICNEIFKEWNDIARTFSYVKETGYDGIELAPFTFSQYVTDISPETRKEIVKRAREVDLDVIGIHWVFVGPEGLHINHPDKEHRDRAAQYLVDLAQRIDADHFYGTGAEALVTARDRGGATTLYPDAADYPLIASLPALPPSPIYGRDADAMTMAQRAAS